MNTEGELDLLISGWMREIRKKKKWGREGLKKGEMSRE